MKTKLTLLSVITIACLFTTAAWSATRTWDGSASGFLTNAANWTGSTAPTNGDSLVFPGTTRLIVTNTVAAPNGFGSLSFTGTNYVVRVQAGASPLTFTGGISNNTALVTNSIEAPVTLSNNINFFAAAKGQLFFGQNVNLNSRTASIRGSDVVLQTGFVGSGVVNCEGGDLFLQGNTAINGPINVNGGRLIADGSVSATNIVIIDGTLTGSGTVSGFTNFGGTVSPGDHGSSLTPDSLAVFGNATFSAGSLFQCDVTSNAFDAISVTGVVNLNNASLSVSQISPPPPNTVMQIITNDLADPVIGTFTNKPEGALFTVAGDLYRISYTSGSGNDVTLTRIAPTGTTNVWDGGGDGLNWANAVNWAGNVAPVEGSVLRFPAPLGGGVNINNFAADRFYSGMIFEDFFSVQGNRVLINGSVLCISPGGTDHVHFELPVKVIGSLLASNGNASATTLLFDDLELTNNAALTTAGAHAVAIGNLHGTGSVTHAGPGLVNFQGTNSFTGPVVVRGGTLGVQSTAVAPFGGSVTVSNGATLSIAGILTNGESLFLNGRLQISGTNQWTGPITVAGTNSQIETLFPGSVASKLVVDGAISGGRLVLSGNHGEIFLNGDNTLSGPLLLGAAPAPNGPAVYLNGNQPSLTVSNFSTLLSGTGTVGNLTMANNGFPSISPGPGAATLTMSNLIMQGSYFVNIDGPNPGSGYDQLIVRGSLSFVPGNAFLTPTFSFTPAIGQPLVIITNTTANPVVGNFSGFPEGAFLTNNGVVYQVSYVGGDGNDVTLTRILTVGQALVTQSAVVTNSFQLTGQGAVNSAYVLEASTNLVNWSAISTNNADGSGVFHFVDQNFASFPIRFYRVRFP